MKLLPIAGMGFPAAPDRSRDSPTLGSGIVPLMVMVRWFSSVRNRAMVK
jgi:hypothetical protein